MGVIALVVDALYGGFGKNGRRIDSSPAQVLQVIRGVIPSVLHGGLDEMIADIPALMWSERPVPLGEYEHLKLSIVNGGCLDVLLLIEPLEGQWSVEDAQRIEEALFPWL